MASSSSGDMFSATSASFSCPLSSSFFSHAASSCKSTGLFGYNILCTANGFSSATDLALRKSREIVAKVASADNDGDLLKTVKRLDQLSDLLCSVIDAAQCIKYVHPDPQFVKAADDAFSTLTHFLNQLNTNSELYNVKILYYPVKRRN